MGQWVKSQRQARKGNGKSQISEEQIQKLNEIKFDWSPGSAPRSSRLSHRSDFTIRATSTGPLGIKIEKTSDFKTVVEEVNNDSQLLGQVQEARRRLLEAYQLEGELQSCNNGKNQGGSWQDRSERQGVGIF